MAGTSYSALSTEDMVTLMPEAAMFIQHPTQADINALEAIVSKVIKQKMDAISLLGRDMSELQRANTDDPTKILNTLARMEDAALEMRKIIQFMHVLEYAFPAQHQAQLARLKDKALPVLENNFHFLAASYLDLAVWAAKLPESVRELLQLEPGFEPQKIDIAAYVKPPRQSERRGDRKKLEALDVSGFIEARRILDYVEAQGVLSKENKPLAAKAICTILAYRQQGSRAFGYESELNHFIDASKVPPDFCKWLRYATQRKFPELSKDIKYIDGKGQVGQQRVYDWNEAREIVVGAYQALDPEMGAIASEAFDKGRIVARDDIVNSELIPPAFHRQKGIGYPLIMTHYSGNVESIRMLGHEMGHYIASVFASRKQNICTDISANILQEHFAALGEIFIQQELLRHARSDSEKLHLRSFKLRQEIVLLAQVPQAELEKELYALINAKPSGLSYGEIYAKYTAVAQQFGIDPPPLPVWSNFMKHVIKQTCPLLRLSYPIAQIGAEIMYQAFQTDPNTFRRNYHEIMEAGVNCTVEEAWNKVVGQQGSMDKDRIDRYLNNLRKQAKDLRRDADKASSPSGASASDATGFRTKSQRADDFSKTR